MGLIVLYPLFALFLSRREWFKYAFRLKKFWARWIMTVPGLFLRVTYKIPVNQLPATCIYCANHVSYLDIITSYLITPNYFVFMGKQELDKAPLFRIFFKEMNILVDRKSNVGSHRAFVKAGKHLDRGESVFLFPEGTIPGSRKLMGFKNGAFKLAIEKQVPIVPVTFLNNWKMLENGGFFKSNGRPGISRIVVHEPVETKGLTEKDMGELLQKVRNIIQKELEHYQAS